MGKEKIEANIPSDKLNEILLQTQKLLHQLSMDIGYLDGARSQFDIQIPVERSPKNFLLRISNKN